MDVLSGLSVKCSGQAIEQEALVNLLVEKGIISKEEIIGEIKRLKEKYLK